MGTNLHPNTTQCADGTRSITSQVRAGGLQREPGSLAAADRLRPRGHDVSRWGRGCRRRSPDAADQSLVASGAYRSPELAS